MELAEEAVANPTSMMSEKLMCGVSAYVCFLTWVFLLFSPIFPVGGGSLHSDSFDCLLRMLFLFSAAVVYFLLRFCADWLVARRTFAVLAVLGSAFALFASAGSFFVLPSPVLEGAFWALAGVGAVFLSLQSLRFLSSLSHHQLIVSTTLTFAASALLTCLVFFLSPPIVRSLMTALLPVGAGIFGVVGNVIEESEHAFASISDSRERAHMSWKSFGAVVGHTVCLGFALSVMFTLGEQGTDDALPVVFGSITIFTISVGAAIEGTAGSGRLLDEGIQLRFTVPLAIAGLAPMFFFGSRGITLCCCVLLATFILQEITNVDAIAENIRLDRLNVVHVASGSRPANAAGLAAGYLLGSIAVSLYRTAGPMSAMAVALALIFALSCLSSILYKNRYPGIGDEVDDFLSLGSGKDVAAKRLGWRKRCEAFGEKIGLSPRQYDVFILLARGHNASYIARKLVISNHTVKSHTYAIYQKAMVHSKQELIEKIEASEPSD